MSIFGVTALFAGLAILVLLQLYLAIMIFSTDPVKGLVSLLVPCYPLLWARRHRNYGKFLLAYFSGAALMVLGVLILR